MTDTKTAQRDIDVERFPSIAGVINYWSLIEVADGHRSETFIVREFRDDSQQERSVELSAGVLSMQVRSRKDAIFVVPSGSRIPTKDCDDFLRRLLRSTESNFIQLCGGKILVLRELTAEVLAVRLSEVYGHEKIIVP